MVRFLEIKDEDFMPFTNATYKLSIRFENFYKLGDKGFHYPFGFPFENDELGNKEFWFLKKVITKNTYTRLCQQYFTTNGSCKQQRYF